METQPAYAALEQALSAEPPSGLEGLDEDKLMQLAELITHARDRQQQHMRQALEDALSYVPGLARGAVRKVLFPKGDRS